MDLVELSESSFITPVKLKTESAANLWNQRIMGSTRMFVDFGGVPKLILTDGELNILRYIPYHCVREFSVLGQGKLSLPPEPKMSKRAK
jgi:hypothetical protein